jgi:hypothetical protein
MSKTHNPTTQMTTMSKAEAIQMLKDAGVEPSKIKMLENGEMAKTEGEFWWFLVPIVMGIAGGYVGSQINKHNNEPIINQKGLKNGFTFTYRF